MSFNFRLIHSGGYTVFQSFGSVTDKVVASLIPVTVAGGVHFSYDETASLKLLCCRPLPDCCIVQGLHIGWRTSMHCHSQLRKIRKLLYKIYWFYLYFCSIISILLQNLSFNSSFNFVTLAQFSKSHFASMECNLFVLWILNYLFYSILLKGKSLSFLSPIMLFFNVSYGTFWLCAMVIGYKYFIGKK